MCDPAVKRVEEHFRVCKIEYLHLFTPEGELVYYGRGKKDSCPVPEGMDLTGMILTHNHPNDSDLSAADLRVMLLHGLREIRAYGRDCVYSFKAPWPRKIEIPNKDFKEWKKLFRKDPLAQEKMAKRFGLEYGFESVCYD